MSRPRDVCEGLDLRCCMDCARWTRNARQPVGEFDRFIRPTATDAGQCPDWRPLPPMPVAKPEDRL